MKTATNVQILDLPDKQPYEIYDSVQATLCGRTNSENSVGFTMKVYIQIK